MGSTLLSILVVVSCIYACSATYLPSCRPPQSPAYGGFYPQKNNYYVGTIVKFFCKDGFLLKGFAYTKCVQGYGGNAVWKYASPRCQAITCPVLTDPQDGSVTITGRTPGSKATYACGAGFVLVGTSTAKCQLNGRWSSSPPTCKPILCPKLTAPENGAVDDGDNRVGTKATYTCNDGFKISGPSMRVCQEDGSWTLKAPVCILIECPVLENPANGVVDDGDNLPGTKAMYKCNSGFRLVGASKRLCQPDGSWAGEAPVCKLIKCPVLENPANGVVDDGDNLPGTKAMYKCNSGFRLVGASKRLCQPDGSWAGEAPVCKLIKCPVLENPANGVVDDGDNLPGTKAMYKCNSGFRLVGASKRLCQPDGSWAGEAPVCKLIKCPVLENPANGVVDDGDNLPGTKAMYKCNSGFRLVGASKRLCQPDGSWAGEAPVCKLIKCPVLENPANGVVDDGDNLPGTKAMYKCNSGFRLVGASKRLCQPDGSWAGEAPVCKLIKCPVLENPANGVVDDGDNLPGTKAMYKCNSGFRLVGASKRLCQPDGSWAGEAPVCKLIKCPVLENPANGVVDDGDNLPGTKAMYKCNSGFRLVGASKRLCQPDGSWAGEAPVCKLIKCPVLENPANGVVDDGDNLPGTKAMYKCNSGFRLVGASKRLCQPDGSWAGEAPVCKLIKCPVLENPANGVVDDGDNLPGTKAMYKCNDGFRLVGASKRLCQPDGSWAGEAPVCKLIKCPVLENPANGVVDDGDNLPGTKAMYKCNSGFRLVGASKRLCQPDGSWAGEAPVCKLIKCPVLENPANGVVDDGDNLPGTKAMYKCNDGFRLVGASKRLCQPDGSWAGEAPVCKLIKCPVLENPANGVVDDGDNLPGTKAMYKCNSGFRLVGASKRLCQPDGSWAGEAPVCKLIKCPVLENPANGVVDDGDNLPGTKAMYKCNSGFRLVGASKRLCQPDGSWAGEAPVCKLIKCPVLENPANGVVDDGDNLPGTKAMYKCNRGFRLVGASKRLCQPDGSWAGEAPVCKLIKCPVLKNPANGVVDDGDNLPGTKAMYKCNDGFRLVGASKRLCQPDGSWAGEAPVCKLIKCPVLENPANGVVDDGDNLPGTRAMYKCNSGFRLVGASKRLCQPDGSWAGEAPVCKLIKCPVLENPANGVVDDGDNLPGTKAMYKCNSGFRLVGASKRLCQPDGSWAGEAPVCKLIKCPVLENPANGIVDDGDNLPGTKAMYKCNDGFRLAGASKRLCQPDGSWAGEAPVCKLIKCPVLENPANGVVDDGDNLPGTRAMYKCNDGFRLVGASKRLCQPDGSWAGEAPVCKLIKCPVLENPANGVVDDGDNLPGTKAMYKCNSGFRLVGASKRLCQPDGSWAGEAPVCKLIKCPVLENPANGVVDDGDNLPGTKAMYKCNSGFRLVGASKRLCQPDGSWAGEAPVCKLIKCPVLENPANGVVDDDDNLPGTKAMYKCNDGFRLVGASKRLCQPDGSWAGEAPVCKLIKCPALESPENGKVRVSGRHPGDRADYSCNDGFQLDGVAWRKCQGNGEWTGEAPTCRRVQCPELTNPKNGKVRVSGRHPGDRADYSCNDGFQLDGVAWRKCQGNGEWTGEAPTCRRVQCPELTNPENGKVRVSGRYPGDRADYSCNDGFQLDGVAWRKCQGNGEWTGEAPTCRRVQCPELTNPKNGKVRVSGRHPGDRADYSCNDGFQLDGVAWRKCQGNGEWTGEAPTCRRVQCPELTNPKNGKVRVSGRHPGDRADYSCNDGFQLVGVAWRKCQGNGQWTGEAPTCRRVQCPELTNPKNGKVRVSGRYPGDRADYSCNDGFQLVGVAWRKCQGNGEWTGEAPTCRRVQCPELTDPKNGKVRVSGRYPGDGADYSCNQGYKLVGDSWRKCQSNGEWSGEAPTCKRIGCGTPPKPLYGYVKFSSTTLGSKAIYGCQSGYHLIGHSVRFCTDNGHWSGSTPRCRRIYFSDEDDDEST